MDYFISCEADACREIVLAKSGVAAMEPETMISLFKKAVASNPNDPALESMHGKVWTWKQYHDDIITLANGLVALGYKPFETGSIIGFNSPEWVIANMACIFAGGKSALQYSNIRVHVLLPVA